MYAIIETGAKQYKVAKGDVIEVERLNYEAGKDVIFDSVLLTVGEDSVKIGRPYLKEAKVTAEALSDFKARKVIAFKYRRRKSSKTTKGHRQQLTRLRIKEIKVS